MTVGRYVVARHWRTRWKVQDQSYNPPRDLPRLYDTQADAQAAADRLNTPTPRAATHQQPTLFSSEERTA